MATIISTQNEQLLNEVVSSGRFNDPQEALTEALKLLSEHGANGDPGQPLATDEWISSFRAWSRKPRRGNPHIDDSRESIYDDCGA
jgi:hypothetical protein